MCHDPDLGFNTLLNTLLCLNILKLQVQERPNHRAGSLPGSADGKLVE